MTRRWELTAVFCSLMMVIGRGAMKESSEEEELEYLEEELESGEGGKCMRRGSGETERDCCCKEADMLFSSVERQLLEEPLGPC